MLTDHIWERCQTTFRGQPLSLEIKRPNFLEAKAFGLAASRVRLDVISDELPRLQTEEGEARTEADAAERRARMDSVVERRTKVLHDFYQSLPDDFVRQVFQEFVRGVQGLISGETGQPVTSGADLLLHADQGLVLFVLFAVVRRMNLEPAEGNVSSSLSTSAREGEMAAGRSTATPAASADGRTPATAMATSRVAPPSSALAEMEESLALP